METATMRDRLRSDPRSNRQINDQPYLDHPEPCGSTAVADPLLSRHEVEQNVWKVLQAVPGVHFRSLIVRRTCDGVCLQGVMETDTDEAAPDVVSVIRRVAPVLKVMNCIVVRECCGRPVHPR
jgi:hypothetical protein